MSTIAVLGTGLLGRGFAQNLMSKGHEVRVWNRTVAKTEPLVAAGATAGADPADTVRGADRVHLVLSHDAVVDDVIAKLEPGLGDGVFVIDHSTNAPEGVRTRFAELRGRGVKYLHAPVFMGPTNSREATGLMLVSGPPDDIVALEPVLATMTGRVLSLGADPARAAVVKLTGNATLVMMAGAMGDVFAIGRANGMKPEEVLTLFEMFAPTPAGMGRRVLSAETRPANFELTMGRKDVRLMIETAGADQLLLLPAIAEAMDARIAAGDGTKDFGIFALPKS
ncbi:MAG: NAD(P)-binding domain-containing protein [Myxococcota bacterium]